LDGDPGPDSHDGPDRIVWDDVPEASQATRTGHAARQHGHRRRRSRRRTRSRLIVGLLAAASAVGGALAGCHPTGTAGVDAVYSALVAIAVTLAASRASRATLLVLTAVAVVMSRGWLLAPSGAALVLAFGGVFPRRARRRLNALIGAVAIQVVLRWPPVGFHGSTALVAIGVLFPLLYSAWRRQSPARRRTTAVVAGTLLGLAALFTGLVALGGLLARPQVARGLTAARASLHQLDSASTSTQSTVAQLRAASVAFGAAHSRAGAWWTLGGRLVPAVAQQRQAMAAATDAGYDLAAVASRETGQLDLAGLRYQAGQINLAAIRAAGPPLADLDEQLAEAQGRLAGIRSAWLVAPVGVRLDHLATELAQAHNSADLAVAAVKAGPDILGGDGVRHYFVAFMTPAETRGLGGFIGVYAELTVGQGRISLSRAGQIRQLNTALSTVNPQLTGVPQYLARYGSFDPATHFQDVTYSPDLPTVAKVITELYAQAGGGPIDGVLVLDPQALAALLTITGPVTIAGLPEPLTATNAADVLLRQQYADLPALGGNVVRHDLLQDALQQAFAKLSTGSLPGPARLADLLSPEVRQGRLLFWSNHPSEQPFLLRLGLAGAFPQPGPGSDVLAVTIANAANNKIDAYLHEQISDAVRYDPTTGQVDATVTIALDNTAPGGGLPDEIIGSYPGSGLPLGTNFLWLSVYSPLGLTGAAAAGQVVGFSPGTPELGVRAYSTFVRVPAQSTKTLVITLAGTVAPGRRYQMTLRLQPLAYTPSMSVSVQPPAGGTPISWTAGNEMVQEHIWKNVKD
jgi:hypothetical protein